MDALRQQVAKASAAYSEWTALHARATAALSTAVNILARLPSLQDAAGHLEALGLGAEARAEVLAKQLAALQEALAAVHAAHARAAAAVRELERAALEAGKRGGGAGGGAGAMPLAAAAQRRGPEPSVAEAIEALQDAWCAFGVVPQSSCVCLCGSVGADSTALCCISVGFSLCPLAF